MAELCPLPRFDPLTPPESAARRFAEIMRLRRSVRQFSERPVSRETIGELLRTASSAPSGANEQPWRFVAVSESTLKRQIREAAEREGQAGAPSTGGWPQELAALESPADKQVLETAPWLIAVFRLTRNEQGEEVPYGPESVGIAVGFLLAAIHHAGLVALTHTPVPTRSLGEILGRPAHELPFAVIAVGYPTEGCQVPILARKALEEVAVFR